MGEPPGHVAGFSKAKSTKEPKDELFFIKALKASRNMKV